MYIPNELISSIIQKDVLTQEDYFLLGLFFLEEKEYEMAFFMFHYLEESRKEERLLQDEARKEIGQVVQEEQENESRYELYLTLMSKYFTAYCYSMIGEYKYSNMLLNLIKKDILPLYISVQSLIAHNCKCLRKYYLKTNIKEYVECTKIQEISEQNIIMIVNHQKYTLGYCDEAFIKLLCKKKFNHKSLIKIVRESIIN